MSGAPRRGVEPVVLQIAAHEIGNVLTPLGVQLEILAEEGLTPTGQRAIEILRGALRRCELQLASLVDVEFAFGSAPVIRPRRLDLRAVVQEDLGVFDDLLRRRGIEVITDLAPAAWVEADAERIHQVMHNLLINAARYTLPGGAVACTLEPDLVRIENTGTPIPRDERERIFDAQQAPRASVGRGLGLAISRAIVEAHGGSLACVDGPCWGGPCFELRLPRTDGAGPDAGR